MRTPSQNSLIVEFCQTFEKEILSVLEKYSRKQKSGNL